MLKRILYTLLSVLLLSLPWLGGSALTLFVAFVPLLWVEHSLAGQTGRRGKPRRFWPYVVSAFVLWWLATVWWVGYAAVIGVVAATVVGATQMSVVFLVYHAVLRRARRALACTVLVSGWIAYETLFINGEISFPWLVLGNAFAQDVRLVQWYEWTGALGGSLWVLVTNLLVFEAIRRPRGWRGWAAPALAFVVPAAVSLTMYATYREPERTVRVTVVQPNIDPYYEKFVLKQAEQRGILLSLMAQAPEDVDFIVAPETAIDEDFWEKSIGRAPAIVQFRDFVRERYPSALVVTGANTLRRYPSEREASPTARCNRDSTLWYDIFNSALGIDSSERIGIHHKAKLVIGAEMTPYYSALKKLKFLTVDLGGISGQLGMDSIRRVFASPRGVWAGPAICYEAIYGEYFTEFVRRGAELMFVISNDGWWDDTPGYRYLFAYSRLRAIENRRSIARSANMGRSGFINQRGDVGETLGWDERGALTAELSLNDRLTFYTRYGDVIGRLAGYVFVLSLLYFMAYRVRRRSHLVE